LPNSELHIADDDPELLTMSRLPAPLNSAVQAHIEACHYRPLRVLKEARIIWKIRDSLAGA
jgi:hypothetical protein